MFKLIKFMYERWKIGEPQFISRHLAKIGASIWQDHRVSMKCHNDEVLVTYDARALAQMFDTPIITCTCSNFSIEMSLGYQILVKDEPFILEEYGRALKFQVAAHLNLTVQTTNAQLLNMYQMAPPDVAVRVWENMCLN